MLHCLYLQIQPNTPSNVYIYLNDDQHDIFEIFHLYQVAAISYNSR